MALRGMEYLRSGTKRRLDVVGATALTGALLPVGVSMGVVSMLDVRTLNPVLRQFRIGVGGEAFKVLKFRTLDPRRAESGPRQVLGTFDPRASRVGQLARRAGLDELPQLLNVLVGSMSLVGARPLLESEIERYQAAAPRLFDEWHACYQAAKPGLVGESQVHRKRYHKSVDPSVLRTSMVMDLKYFDTATLRGDVQLLWSTPIALLQANRTVTDTLPPDVFDGEGHLTSAPSIVAPEA